MVKPPKTMQPEGVDLAKAGRSAGKAFQEDSFHNYMGRKIHNQRQQFGLEICPDPREQQQQQQQQQPAKSSCLSQSPNKKKNVTFAQGVKDNEKEPMATTGDNNNKKKRKRKSPVDSMLKRLKKRHGSARKRQRTSPSTMTTTTTTHDDDTLIVDLPQEQSLDNNSPSMNNADDLVARALEREQKEAEQQQRQQQHHQQREMEQEKEIQMDEYEGDSDSDTPNKQQPTTTVLETNPHQLLRRDRPDLFFLGIVVMVNGFTNPDSETIQRLMHRHGGDLEKYETQRITHIIAQNLSTAKANMYKAMRKPRPVVKPSWIVDCVKEGRLLPHGDYLIDEIKHDHVTSVKSFFSTTKSSKLSSTTTSTKNDENSAVTESIPSETAMTVPSPVPSPSTGKEEINSIHDVDHCGLLASEEQEQANYNEAKNNDNAEQNLYDKLSETEEDGFEQEQQQQQQQQEEDGEDESSIQSSQRELFADVPCNQEAFAEMNSAQQKDSPDDGTDSPTHNPLTDHHNVTSPLSFKGRTDSKYINGQIRTVGSDPNFLDSFFQNSRLSFIGSYKQRTKESPTKTKSRHAITNIETQRFVLHCDMDYFFAAVVLRNYPEYQNRPVAISHFGKEPDGNHHEDYPQANKNSSSECATCNYEARKFGIKKGMYLGRARQLCPTLIVLPYDFVGYEEVAEQVATILHRVASEYDGEVEQVSCDESYVELFFPIGEGMDDPFRRAGEVANALRRDILQTTKCTATVGVGQNKFLAKLGTDRVKPNGSFVVKDHTKLLQNLKLRDLHGVGYRFERRLEEEGLVSVQDVWDLEDAGERALSRILGPGLGKKIFDFCNGKDDRPVKPADRKTIGAECNYGVRFDGPYGVDYMIAGLAKEVEKRMKATKVWGSRVTLKLKQRKKGAPPPPKFLGHGSCHNLSKSIEVACGHTQDWKVIEGGATKLLTELNIPTEDIRGMGIVVSKLECADAEKSRCESGINQSITKWFGHSSGTAKNHVNRESKSDEEQASYEDGGFAIPLDNGDEPTRLDHQQIIDESTLQEMPPKIQQNVRNGRTVLSSSSSWNEQEDSSSEQSNDGDGDDDDGRVSGQEILNLSQDSVEVAEDETDIVSENESEQNFCDVALPPLSQIHMSQVEALPSSLREQITSKLVEHAQASSSVRSHNNSPINNSNRGTPLKRKLGQDDGKEARYRQLSVKRLFRLGSVKSGQNDSLSASQLQNLPLEMQLQLANEDTSKIGTLSQRKPKRQNGRGRRSSAASKKNGSAAHFRRQSEPIRRTHQPDHYLELEQSGVQGLIERATSREQLEQDQNVGADPDSEAPVDRDTEDQPTDFYSNNVAPLDAFLDENPEPKPAEIQQVIQFLCICVRERRLCDVVLLLRHIKNRTDWSNIAYPQIFSEVDRTCEEVEGYRMDRQVLNL